MQTDDWIPSIEARKGHRYIAIVESLAADIQTGRIKPGARLLPQRDLADRLKLSVGTVSKAYAEAEQRGLISGEVGRGTFVLGRRRYVPASDISGPAAIDLALNVSPFTGAEEVISDTLAQIASDGSAQELFGYLPHQGLHEHREEIAGWLSRQGAETNPDFLIITHGAQHAISIAIGVATPPATTVLTENLTYSGMVALSAKVGYRLHGVAMDENGLIPDALETAFDKTGARALYCMPTLQTPTGSVMPEDRRCAIAEIIRRHKAFLSKTIPMRSCLDARHGQFLHGYGA
ncbi:MAG: PLP-dependent aminotransferase family protein [Pseudolabrys sp.]